MKRTFTFSMAIVAMSVATANAADTFPAKVSLGQTYSGTIEQTVKSDGKQCEDKHFNFDNSANAFESGAKYILEGNVSGCGDWKQIAVQTDLDSWGWHQIWNESGITSGSFKDTITAKAGLSELIGFKLTPWELADGKTVTAGSTFTMTVSNFKISKLGESGSGEETSTGTNLNIDFEDKNIGDTYGMRKWHDEDGTATVTSNPSGTGKVVNIITSDYNAVLQLPVTLPTGKTLADVTSLAFDIYIPTSASDANPNYKDMEIYINGTKVSNESGYASQAEITKWTTKSYLFSDLTITDKTLTSFSLAFGLNTNPGNYYIDNVAIAVQGASSSINTADAAQAMLITNSEIRLNEIGNIMVYNLNGEILINKQQVETVNLNQLTKGVYVVKATINQKNYTQKIIK